MSQTPRVGSTAFTSGYGGPKGLSHSIIHWTTSGSLIGSPDQNSVTSARTRLKSTLHIPPPQPQAKGRSPMAMVLRPYERSRCAEHEEVVATLGKELCARPTGDGHGRTTEAPAQRRGGTNLRATLEVG